MGSKSYRSSSRILGIRILLWLVLVLVSSAFWGDDSGLSETGMAVEITSNRDVYAPGEPVELTITKCNVDDEPVTACHACPCCNFDIDILETSAGEVASYDYFACISVLDCRTWEPGDCTDETFYWNQTVGDFDGNPNGGGGFLVEAGEFTARYEWDPFEFSQVSDSIPFSIVAKDIGAVEIPTLSSVGLGGLVVSLLIAGVVLSRRRT